MEKIRNTLNRIPRHGHFPTMETSLLRKPPWKKYEIHSIKSFVTDTSLLWKLPYCGNLPTAHTSLLRTPPFRGQNVFPFTVSIAKLSPGKKFMTFVVVNWYKQ
jgi:hypothetical protein